MTAGLESSRGASTRLSEPRPSPLIGRDIELQRLRDLVDPVPAASRVLVVLGDAGMGKSVLLADVAGRAGLAGTRVLSVTGRESETNLGFAALHQLLRPVLDSVADLAHPQRHALEGVLGLATVTAGADRLMTGIAVLTLLSGISRRSPLLVIVDDAHWLDRNSLDVLTFVGHRLNLERIVLLLGARGAAPPAGFERTFPALRLDPLSESNANRLLGEQPFPPRGRARAQVLAQSAGNPMALIELAKAIANDPAAGRRWVEEPLPLGDRLTAVIASQLTALPELTQAALLFAAVADSSDLSSATAVGISELGPDVFVAAEQAGLVKIDNNGPRFSHPLVRSAIYHAAPFVGRAAAHRRLAQALYDQPDRQAWHLAAAAIGPDEGAASILEATAAQAQRRGGAVAAALAMERAAELSPHGKDQARRLISAAEIAVPTGQADWVQDLATRALALTADWELRITARQSVGWALAWSNQHTAALSVLMSVAEEASRHRPDIAWDTLATAASVAYQLGAPAGREAIARAVQLLDRVGPPNSDRTFRADVDMSRIWIGAATDPFGNRIKTLPDLHRIASSTPKEAPRSRLGAAAWLLDESDLAVDLLREALAQLRAPGVAGASGAVLSALGWASIDTGRWDDAVEVSAEAKDLGLAYKMDIVAAAADASLATVFALRGDSDEARTMATRALSMVDPQESRGLTARATHALGLAALADGNNLTAYSQLRRLFDDDGTPLHYHVSYLGVADLAAAAVRADRRVEGRQTLERVLSNLDGTTSPRLEQLLARAGGILADPGKAEGQFDKALSSPVGNRWPLERAQLHLDYAELLRRRRRINEAKPILISALDTFQRLHAAPLAKRAEAELRACGVSVSATPDALLDLTPQQRQIVRMASEGLTNREIGKKLFLSPRTVSSHLYRSFPKLGVTARHELRDVIARADATRIANENDDH